MRHDFNSLCDFGEAVVEPFGIWLTFLAPHPLVASGAAPFAVIKLQLFQSLERAKAASAAFALLKVMENSKMKLALGLGLAALAMGLTGCGTPRSFDPSADGIGYGSANSQGTGSYNSYLQCVDALGPLGQAGSCAQVNAGGAPANTYSQLQREHSAGLERPAAEASSQLVLSKDDSYFQYVDSLPEEVRQAQENAWLALAAAAR